MVEEVSRHQDEAEIVRLGFGVSQRKLYDTEWKL